MVKLDQAVGDYAIRVAANVVPQFISGYAVLSYSKTNTTGTVIPPPKNPGIDYGSRPLAGKTELAPMSLQAFPATIKPPQTPNVTLQFQLHRGDSLTWILNKDPFHAHLEEADPLLLNPVSANDYDADLVMVRYCTTISLSPS